MKIEMILRALTLATPLALTLAVGGAQASLAPDAKVQVLQCDFANGRANLIGDRLYILREVATNDIWIFDGVVKSVYKEPIKAQVKNDNASRLELDWMVENVQFTSSTAKVSFHATLLKGEMKILEKSIAGAFENRENREGHCAPSQ